MFIHPVFVFLGISGHLFQKLQIELIQGITLIDIFLDIQEPWEPLFLQALDQHLKNTFIFRRIAHALYPAVL
jgi:hypothetical protein